ncbi:MAG: tyrosine-type recombinase/integrase [Actinomycetota bacterium]
MSQAVAHIGARREPELDLEVWLECYLADCEARGLTARTLEWYRDRGKRLIRHLEAIGVRYPQELTRRTVSRLFTVLRGVTHRGKPLEPQTILGYWQFGKGFTTFLIGEEAYPGPNPFDQFGKPRVPEKVMWAPSAEECRAMLKVPNRRSVAGLRDIVILLLLIDTGIRVSALRGIRVEDVDLRERRIRVVEKGRRERIVPFGFQALRWLRRYLVTAKLGEADFLLPGRHGRAISRKRIDEIIKACAANAGIRDGRASAHDLRRAFAREFLRNGGDLESLRQLLGHTSYAMVRRYAELATDVVARRHGMASPGDHLRP